MQAMTGHIVTIFMSFFAIMNPIANTAVFVSLAEEYTDREQRKIAKKSTMMAFGIIFIFAVLGKLIFEMFGLSLPALRIAGGILVFLIGYQLLHGKQSHMHHPRKNTGNENDEEKEEEISNIAISPLAVPILAGPGTIATAMNYSAAGGYTNILITIVAFAVICLITYLFFIFGQRFVAMLGKRNIRVISRLMGLILAVIGTQMVLQGIRDARLF